MSTRKAAAILPLACLLITLLGAAAVSRADAVVANHFAVSKFAQIPSSVVEQITTDLNFFYGHTSHGSQVMTGLALLQAENALYTRPYFYEYGDDLGHAGDVSWVPPTRSYLDGHPEVNVVMWSWCGGCSDNTPAGISAYLEAMNTLETDYLDVTFIYMTGHLDGSGPTGPLYANNNQIRDWCATNSKILFDFADIESYDPDGNYYPEATDACNWCATWCAAHPGCPDCSCAHSHCFNCYLKGKAFWWLMAKLVGWSPVVDCIGLRGNANGDPDDKINVSDITYLVAFLFGIPSGPAPACLEEGNANGDTEEKINISDITYLVAYLFGIPSGPAPPACP